MTGAGPRSAPSAAAPRGRLSRRSLTSRVLAFDLHKSRMATLRGSRRRWNWSTECRHDDGGAVGCAEATLTGGVSMWSCRAWYGSGGSPRTSVRGGRQARRVRATIPIGTLRGETLSAPALVSAGVRRGAVRGLLRRAGCACFGRRVCESAHRGGETALRRRGSASIGTQVARRFGARRSWCRAPTSPRRFRSLRGWA
jgi:hypothetical protein